MKFYMPRPWDETIADIERVGHEHVGLEEAEVYINTDPRPDRIPEMPANIQWVQHCYTGVDQLIEAGVITADGLPWCNAAGAFAEPVAEAALGLMLSAAHYHKAFAQAATWDVARELDKTQAWLYAQGRAREVAIVGAGGIGKRLAQLLQPFDVNLTEVTRTGPVTLKDVEWDRFDFVVSTLPLTSETAGFFNMELFAAMKDSAVFVNVGRGGTVVTDDLVAALRDGQLAAAGLEVVDPEPLPDGHPLYALPNCVMTPHMAASKHVATFHMGKIFNENAAAWEAGEPMPTRVNATAGY